MHLRIMNVDVQKTIKKKNTYDICVLGACPTKNPKAPGNPRRVRWSKVHFPIIIMRKMKFYSPSEPAGT